MATALTLHPEPRPHGEPPTFRVASAGPRGDGATGIPDWLFERVGLVGTRLRDTLRVAIPGKLLLRGAHDPIALVGATGSGRHLVAELLHLAAAELLGRRGARVETSVAESPGAGALADALRRAAGGTLVVEGLPGLPAAGRRVAARLIETAARRDDVLVLAVVDPLDPEGGLPAARPGPRERLSWWPGTRLELPTLSERGDDVRGLVEHLLRVTSSEAGAAELTTAPEVVAALVAEARARRIESVGELRHLVRDVVFDTFAGRGGPGVLVVEDVAQALGSGHGAGQADATPYEVPAAVDADTLRRLAVIHSVPERVLAQQVTVLQQVIAGLDDAPRSYTNILERAEDIKRVALWLWAGADSQADFRKAFGPQRHMQPSKSVSWAFYNRVFKREV